MKFQTSPRDWLGTPLSSLRVDTNPNMRDNVTIHDLASQDFVTLKNPALPSSPSFSRFEPGMVYCR